MAVESYHAQLCLSGNHDLDAGLEEWQLSGALAAALETSASDAQLGEDKLKAILKFCKSKGIATLMQGEKA